MSDQVEPITFDPIGTVTVTADDGTVHRLRRPTTGQWRHFRRAYDQAQAEARKTLEALHGRLNAVKDADAEDEEIAAIQEEIAAEAERLREHPMWEQSQQWLTDAFAQLADVPLPGDADDWPAWLGTNQGLPERILRHWQTVPKASGPTPSG